MHGTKARVVGVLKTQERSQAWLARRINMNATLLAHYLSGRRTMPADLVPRMAHVLGVSESALREPLTDITDEVAA